MTHSYLAISLLICLGGCAAVLLLRRGRWFAATAGVLALPTGFADVIFVPEYWAPTHLIGAWLSIEGALFSLGNGWLIGAIAARWHGSALPPRPADRDSLVRALLRLTAAMAGGFCLFVALWQGAFGRLMVMHAVLVGLAAMVFALWWRGKVRAGMALSTGIGFALLYAVQTAVWGRLNADLAAYWHDAEAYLWRVPVAPFLPVEEYLWALFYGALWANLLAWGFDRPAGRRDPDAMRGAEGLSPRAPRHASRPGVRPTPS